MKLVEKETENWISKATKLEVQEPDGKSLMRVRRLPRRYASEKSSEDVRRTLSNGDSKWSQRE